MNRGIAKAMSVDRQRCHCDFPQRTGAPRRRRLRTLVIAFPQWDRRSLPLHLSIRVLSHHLSFLALWLSFVLLFRGTAAGVERDGRRRGFKDQHQKRATKSRPIDARALSLLVSRARPLAPPHLLAFLSFGASTAYFTHVEIY